MKALVYHAPNDKSWDEVPDPELIDDTDAVVWVDATTICGSDLHIFKGDLPEVTPGRILGHEAVGTVEDVGTAVKNIRPGDRVLSDRYVLLSAGEDCVAGRNFYAVAAGIEVADLERIAAAGPDDPDRSCGPACPSARRTDAARPR